MKGDDASILDMLKAGRNIIASVRGLEFGHFRGDWRLQFIVLHQLIIMGEVSPRAQVTPWRDYSERFAFLSEAC